MQAPGMPSIAFKGVLWCDQGRTRRIQSGAFAHLNLADHEISLSGLHTSLLLVD